jgi:deoxyribodipyrimidine photo-lyase
MRVRRYCKQTRSEVGELKSVAVNFTSARLSEYLVIMPCSEKAIRAIVARTISVPDPDQYLCELDTVLERMGQFDPRRYDQSRNYLHGEVSWLSPFLTHGITGTQEFAQVILSRHTPKHCYRILFELAWREFFHRTWQLHGELIFKDMRDAQQAASHREIPRAVLTASTGIDVVDTCLHRLLEDGLMHNHSRMWVASIVCNLAHTDWLEPARWLHYHLLDGDLASNTLSWQWIAGTFSHKRYLANQGNIDKFSDSRQPGSWLDVTYEELDVLGLPDHMQERGEVVYKHPVPGSPIEPLVGELALRSIWQLDPRWQAEIQQHIVFIDTVFLQQWPMSKKRWRFIQYWAAKCKARIYFGTVEELAQCTVNANVIRQEYPACLNWPGTVTDRPWLYPMPEKPFSSFSKYFKMVKSHVGV